MIVVADASPLNYLIQIELEALLQKHFGRVRTVYFLSAR